MTNYQVKYWFESNSRDRSGEQVIETIQAENAKTVAQSVEANLSKNAFTINPSFGPAQEGGCVVIHTAQVRYVEIIPVGRA